MIERRYDIDWLRVIAIGLLLIYHIAIGFQPWGVFIGFIQNSDSLEWLWIPMSMLNVWRIPLLFFVSGMGVYFAIQRRNWKELLVERSKRILLPFIFGMAAIVPLHVYLWQDYYSQKLMYTFHPAHLWFLGNIFIYVLVLSPLFFYLKKRPNGEFHQLLNRLFKSPLGLLAIVIPFILEVELVRPENFEMYAFNVHGFWLGMVAFLVGFLCVFNGKTFWNTALKWRWLFLGLGFALYGIRISIFEMTSPYALIATESVIWILAVLGIGHRHLNRPSKALNYLSSAAYPIYIIHMFFLYLGSALLFNQPITGMIKFFSLLTFTTAGCLLTYEFIIRRIKLLRPLFGLKSEKSN